MERDSLILITCAAYIVGVYILYKLVYIARMMCAARLKIEVYTVRVYSFDYIINFSDEE